MFKVGNTDTRIVNFEHILQTALVLLLLILGG